MSIMPLPASKLRECQSVTPEQQAQADEYPWETLKEAQDFAEEIRYSFTAEVKGTRWRVFPGYRKPQKIEEE